MSRRFIIVIPTDAVFEVGIADGIWPWTHLATCNKVDDANRICTLLAMHYRVPARCASEVRTEGTKP